MIARGTENTFDMVLSNSGFISSGPIDLPGFKTFSTSSALIVILFNG